MAAGVASKFMAEWGVATIGVAGPGLIDGLAVGSAFVAVVGPSFSQAVRFSFDGSRAEIRQACVVSALNLLNKALD
jgi:nicotinamide mononucleotide (NMN) deamidase PncC